MQNISINDWIIRYRKGDFNSITIDNQKEAGWIEWCCDDRSLLTRTKKMGKILTQLRENFILSNYTVRFKNNQHNGVLYDMILFEPLTDGMNSFTIICDHGCSSIYQFNLYIGKCMDPDYSCNDLNDLVAVLNSSCKILALSRKY